MNIFPINEIEEWVERESIGVKGTKYFIDGGGEGVHLLIFSINYPEDALPLFSRGYLVSPLPRPWCKKK